jgi:hypothetical protein
MATVFIGTGNTQYLAGRLEENAVFFENNCQIGIAVSIRIGGFF